MFISERVPFPTIAKTGDYNSKYPNNFDPPQEHCYAKKVLRRVSVPLAGGLLGGSMAGLADIIALMLSGPSAGPSYFEWLALLIIGVTAGLTAGGALALLLAPLTLRLRKHFNFKIAVVMLDAGVAAVVIDRFIQVNYYPEFHFLIALAGLSLAVFGGGFAISFAASEFVLLGGAVLAVLGTLWAPTHLEFAPDPPTLARPAYAHQPSRRSVARAGTRS